MPHHPRSEGARREPVLTDVGTRQPLADWRILSRQRSDCARDDEGVVLQPECGMLSHRRFDGVLHPVRDSQREVGLVAAGQFVDSIHSVHSPGSVGVG